jgi:iron complex transport system permease protein
MQISRLKFSTIYLALVVVLIISTMLSIHAGAVDVSYREIVLSFAKALGFHPSAKLDPVQEGLFMQIRLPRIILCMIVGAGLSVSGALMQALFRNPIVEPGLIGTSSGAAFGAALVFVVGKTFVSQFSPFLGTLILPLSAFVFGLAATLLVYKLSSSFGKVSVATMILVGIAVNAIAAGGTGFLSYMARDPQARSITFWSLGTFSGADWPSVYLVFTATLISILAALRYSKGLNALLLGEEEAGYLGVDTEKLKIRIILVNTLMVAVGTSVVGVIGFVGLIVPHLLRMVKSSDNRFLIIGSALLGAILMNAADMVSRVLLAPAELPIGIVTAIVGAPVFLIILKRQSGPDKKGGFYA